MSNPSAIVCKKTLYPSTLGNFSFVRNVRAFATGKPSGVFIVIPKKDAVHPDISVEEGLKSIISGGILDAGTSLSTKLPNIDK